MSTTGRGPSHDKASQDKASQDGSRVDFDRRFNAELVGTSGPLSSLTFEQILAALEDVTNRMANGELGIEAATDLYEQAEVLHAAARARLDAVEARISRLAGPPGAG